MYLGAVEDEQAVLAALQGAYGAFVNTDSFTIGEQKEIFYGIRIFELAKQARTVRQYVWSSLDYVSKVRTSAPPHISQRSQSCACSCQVTTRNIGPSIMTARVAWRSS